MKQDCLILLFALFLALGTSKVIVTQRGVVAGIGNNWNGDRSTFFYDKWFLQERTYKYDNPPQFYTWKISSDSRFPYGVFIESTELPGLVWEIKGYNANLNAIIGLYKKKTTTVDTKNQRWLITSAGEFVSVLDENMVIKVNAGQLVLGQKDPSNPQKLLFVTDVGTMQIVNHRYTEVYASSVTPWGWNISKTIPVYNADNEWSSTILPAFEDTTIYLKNYQGKVVSPSPIIYNSTAPKLYYTIDAIPVGTYSFTGQWDGPSTMTATITIKSPGRGKINGRGRDTYSGEEFDLIAEFDYKLLSLTKTYDYGASYNLIEGIIFYDPFSIAGHYTDDGGNQRFFEYKMN